MKYKHRYADIRDARQFRAIFSVGGDSFVFDRRNVYLNNDVGAWTLQ